MAARKVRGKAKVLITAMGTEMALQTVLDGIEDLGRALQGVDGASGACAWMLRWSLVCVLSDAWTDRKSPIRLWGSLDLYIPLCTWIYANIVRMHSQPA